jgi:hypothetical protein
VEIYQKIKNNYQMTQQFHCWVHVQKTGKQDLKEICTPMFTAASCPNDVEASQKMEASQMSAG